MIFIYQLLQGFGNRQLFLVHYHYLLVHPGLIWKDRLVSVSNSYETPKITMEFLSFPTQKMKKTAF